MVTSRKESVSDSRQSSSRTLTTIVNQTAILATGDDDYVRAVEHVQDAGKRVVIASWDNNIGRRMKRVCDEYVELDVIADAIEHTD